MPASRAAWLARVGRAGELRPAAVPRHMQDQRPCHRLPATRPHRLGACRRRRPCCGERARRAPRSSICWPATPGPRWTASIVVKLLITFFERNQSPDILSLMARMLGFTSAAPLRLRPCLQPALVSCRACRRPAGLLGSHKMRSLPHRQRACHAGQHADARRAHLCGGAHCERPAGEELDRGAGRACSGRACSGAWRSRPFPWSGARWAPWAGTASQAPGDNLADQWLDFLIQQAQAEDAGRVCAAGGAQQAGGWAAAAPRAAGGRGQAAAAARLAARGAAGPPPAQDAAQPKRAVRQAWPHVQHMSAGVHVLHRACRPKRAAPTTRCPAALWTRSFPIVCNMCAPCGVC